MLVLRDMVSLGWAVCQVASREVVGRFRGQIHVVANVSGLLILGKHIS
jgi:hypothetical protein